MGGVGEWAFETGRCEHFKACIIADCDLERYNNGSDVQYQKF